MRQLTDSIEIDSPVEPIWRWLADLAEHYTDWHPDHVSAEWKSGDPYQVGSILEVVEYIGGRREVVRFEMASVDPPSGFEYSICGPISMLLPGGSFEITPVDGGSQFKATISYRFGKLTESLFKNRTEALREHMREEGENLKRLIESAR